MPLAAAAAGFVVSDDFLLKNWDIDDGLPSTAIGAVARTQDGYVWLATAFGVARFDGLRFVTFNSDNTPAFKYNRVTALLVDRAGTLWIGTERGGLLKRSGASFEAVDLGEAAVGSAVTALTQDAEGMLWIGTERGTLLRLNRGKRKVFGQKEGWTVRRITQLMCDTAGRLWAVADGKLLTLEDGQWSPLSSGPPGGDAQAIAPALDGGLWVAASADSARSDSGARICKLRSNKWVAEGEPYPWPKDSSRSHVSVLLEDNEGRLWCGTAGTGVFVRSREGGWQHLAPRTSLTQLEILCLQEDESGVIWIGSRTAGIYQARPRLVATRLLPNGTAQREAVTVCLARDGSVWAGTDGAGVCCWRDRKLTRFGLDQGLTNLRVAVLLEDRRTNLWAGTYGGLFRLDGNSFTAMTEPAELRAATLALLEDRHGRIWAGTQTAVVCIEAGSARVYSWGTKPAAALVRALAEDHHGDIWAAVEGLGLCWLKNGQFERYEPAFWFDGSHVIPGWAGEKFISTLHWDEAGTLWLGTRGFGLFRMHDNMLTKWEWRIDGLPSNHVLALLDDHLGNLWLSSENAIFGISKKALDDYQPGRSSLLRPWRLTQTDGLPYKVCSAVGQPAAARSSDGRLWFPNGAALAAFDPAAMLHRVRIWPPVVEDLLADGVRTTPEPDGVFRVKSSVRTLEVHFSSPNITSAERLQFRYKLDGLDKDYFETSKMRVAFFHRLPPGRYRFSVEVCGPGEDWQPPPGPMLLEVIPRLHERTSARIVAALILLSAVAVTVWAIERSRTRRRLDRLKLLQAMDHERQRIAADIHDELGAGLTEITLLGDGLCRDLPKTPALEVASEISVHARALTRSMDEVVWAINPRNDTLESFLLYLNKSAQEYLNKAGVRCRWDLPEDLPDIPLSSEARHHLYMASKEAVHNIIKHSGASEVWIRLKLGESDFQLEIEDNGRGFNLLAPLARGEGLANMRRRFDKPGRQCQLESSPGKGCRVRFVVAHASSSSHSR